MSATSLSISGSPGAEHPQDRVQAVGPRPEATAQLLDQQRLGRVGGRGRGTVDRSLRRPQIDQAQVGELGDHQPRQAPQRRFVVERNGEDGPGVGQELQPALLAAGLVQEPGIIDGHADRAGDGDQQVEVLGAESGLNVLSVDLQDAYRNPLVVPQRNTHQRADPSDLGAPAGGEAAVGPDVEAEDRLALAQDVIEDRPADDQLGVIVVARAVRPGYKVDGPIVLEEHKSTPGLRENPEQGFEDLIQDRLDVADIRELLTDLEERPELHLGPAAREVAGLGPRWPRAGPGSPNDSRPPRAPR